MKYKGIELEEITEPQIFNPPKPMVVWDDIGNPVKLNVCAIVNREDFRVITERSAWRHCAEIPEVLATHRELSRWLAEGKGELRLYSLCSNCSTFISYPPDKDDIAVSLNWNVRKWEDTEWHKPTREYLGLED